MTADAEIAAAVAEWRRGWNERTSSERRAAAICLPMEPPIDLNNAAHIGQPHWLTVHESDVLTRCALPGCDYFRWRP